MIHVADRHKALAVPAIPAVMQQFPQARVVDFAGKSALIPHRFLETRLLRGMGFVVPAPVLYYYDWPHPVGEPPFDAQRQTVAMMTSNQRGYVLNGMGTGKSRCGLWAYDYLRREGLARKMLIVAPLSTLHFTWMREAFKLTPHLSATVLHGTKERRLKRLAENHDIYIINHDGIKVLADELAARKDIDVILIDELTYFRNPRSDACQAMAKLAASRPWVWGMTGTPTPEAPTDAYGQCMIVSPNSVPRRFTHFRDECMTRISQFKYAPRPDAQQVVNRAMQPAVRFTLEDVTELPEVIERTVDVGMGKEQTKIYDSLRNDAFALVETGEINAANAGVVLNKMLQASVGYIYARKGDDTERHVVTLDNTDRLERLVQDLHECERKVIVFSPYKHALEGIANHLAKNKFDYAKVDGDTPPAERDRIFGLFQNTDKFKVICAHPKCMSHGVTLTAADTIIWFGPVDSHETFSQANARIRRTGQKHKQLILMYQGSKAEKASYQRLRRKQSMQDGVLALFAGNLL